MHEFFDRKAVLQQLLREVAASGEWEALPTDEVGLAQERALIDLMGTASLLAKNWVGAHDEELLLGVEAPHESTRRCGPDGERVEAAQRLLACPVEEP